MAILACRPIAELGALQPRPARYWPGDLNGLIIGRLYGGAARTTLVLTELRP